MKSLETLRNELQGFISDPILSIDYLREKALHGGIIELRSLHWKIFLDIIPTLKSDTWALILEQERKGYQELKKKLIIVPTSAEHEADWNTNNPLSLSEESPWQAYFKDAELKKIIQQDVSRCFPEYDLFRKKHVQETLTDILLVWCKMNPEMSYRQGMHELLGLIYLTVHNEALSDSSQPISDMEKFAKLVFGIEHIEEDSALLFFRLMRSAKIWFHVAEDQPVYVNQTNPKAKVEPRAIPILVISKRVQKDLLKMVAPRLSAHLDNLGIEPQLYCIRWIRLMFGREFKLPDVMMLWDGIFAFNASLNLVEWIAVALLMNISDDLMSADYGSALQLLMRYPDLHSTGSSIEILLGEAQRLQTLYTEAATAAARDEFERISERQTVTRKKLHAPWTNLDREKKEIPVAVAITQTGNASLMQSPSQTDPESSTSFTPVSNMVAPDKVAKTLSSDDVKDRATLTDHHIKEAKALCSLLLQDSTLSLTQHDVVKKVIEHLVHIQAHQVLSDGTAVTSNSTSLGSSVEDTSQAATSTSASSYSLPRSRLSQNEVNRAIQSFSSVPFGKMQSSNSNTVVAQTAEKVAEQVRAGLAEVNKAFSGLFDGSSTQINRKDSYSSLSRPWTAEKSLNTTSYPSSKAVRSHTTAKSSHSLDPLGAGLASPSSHTKK